MKTMYTLNDIINLTKLSERTLRRYLEQGLLKGHKLGGIWRFTEQDLKRFFDNQSFNQTISRQASEEVKQFIRREYNANEEGKGCVILDFNAPDQYQFNEIRRIVTETSTKYKGFSMKLYPEGDYTRVVLIGGFDYLNDVTNALTSIKKPE